MSRPIRLALGTATLAVLVFTLRPLDVTAAPEPVRPVDPQWQQIPAAAPPQTPVPPPPKPLTRLQLTESLARAAKRVPMPTIANAPQTLETRLTPAKPHLENGTRIVQARGIDLIMPTVELPDGVYWLLADNHEWPSSSIDIQLRTEKDKLYVADCRVKEVSPAGSRANTLRIQAPGFWEYVRADEGHILFVFRGQEGFSPVLLHYDDVEHNHVRMMAFYGCDFGKAT